MGGKPSKPKADGDTTARLDHLEERAAFADTAIASLQQNVKEHDAHLSEIKRRQDLLFTVSSDHEANLKRLTEAEKVVSGRGIFK